MGMHGKIRWRAAGAIIATLGACLAAAPARVQPPAQAKSAQQAAAWGPYLRAAEGGVWKSPTSENYSRYRWERPGEVLLMEVLDATGRVTSQSRMTKGADGTLTLSSDGSKWMVAGSEVVSVLGHSKIVHFMPTPNQWTFVKSRFEPATRLFVERSRSTSVRLTDVEYNRSIAAAARAQPDARAAQSAAGQSTFPDVQFTRGADNITSGAAAALDRIAEAYRLHGQAQVMISGHSSLSEASAQDKYAVGLSQRRAENVRAYLAGRGIPEGVMTTEAFGSSRPVSGDPARSINARVTVTFGPGSGW
jgi:outer membrane protein OmpA-like peptidoglycan-associated protein